MRPLGMSKDLWALEKNISEQVLNLSKLVFKLPSVYHKASTKYFK